MVCDNCLEFLEVEVLSGSGEPLEKKYTCPKCGRVVLSVEGLGDQIMKEGEKYDSL